MLIYDAACCLCRRSVQLLGLLDRHGAYTSLEYDEAVRRFDAVPAGELEAGVRLLFPSGRQLLGFAAARAVCLRTPVLMPLGLVLLLPGISRVGEAVYDLVSRHRHGVPCI